MEGKRKGEPMSACREDMWVAVIVVVGLGGGCSRRQKVFCLFDECTFVLVFI